MSRTVDAVLLIAFGGPTRSDEVRPFLANVTRGRPIPPDRLEAVAHHYEQIGGCSPLNELTLRQATALAAELPKRGLPLPVFVGMRNWHPFLRETLAEMAGGGHRRAVGLILSAQQSEAGWGRYLENVADARAAVGADAPEIVFTAPWPLHPQFIAAVAAQTAAALARIPPADRAATHTIFTAHSIPAAMAAGSPYVAQIEQGAQAVAARLGLESWSIAYQSRSGNPRDPWLEPDISAALREWARRGVRHFVVTPIGFVCDHVEVLYDLDIEARAIAEQLGVQFERASTVNDHPTFIQMLADLVSETISHQASACPGNGSSERSWL